MKLINYVARMKVVLDSFQEYCNDKELWPDGIVPDMNASEWDEQFIAYIQAQGVGDD